MTVQNVKAERIHEFAVLSAPGDEDRLFVKIIAENSGERLYEIPIPRCARYRSAIANRRL